MSSVMNSIVTSEARTNFRIASVLELFEVSTISLWLMRFFILASEALETFTAQKPVAVSSANAVSIWYRKFFISVSVMYSLATDTDARKVFNSVVQDVHEADPSF